MKYLLTLLRAGLTVSSLWWACRPAAAQTEAVAVDPAELSRRVDLLGRVVVVDDRVRFYQYHPGRGYDEVLLKRTDVVFRLPPRLRPDGPPKPMPVVVKGLSGPRKRPARLRCDRAEGDAQRPGASGSGHWRTCW